MICDTCGRHVVRRVKFTRKHTSPRPRVAWQIILREDRGTICVNCRARIIVAMKLAVEYQVDKIENERLRGTK